MFGLAIMGLPDVVRRLFSALPLSSKFVVLLRRAVPLSQNCNSGFGIKSEQMFVQWQTYERIAQPLSAKEVRLVGSTIISAP